MIVDEHQVARLEPRVRSPGGIGEHRRARSQCARKSHRRRDRLHRVSLVHMESTGLEHYIAALEPRDDDLPGVSGDTCTGESRDLGKEDFVAGLNLVGQPPHIRAHFRLYPAGPQIPPNRAL